MSVFLTSIPIYSDTRDIAKTCKDYPRETWNDLVKKMSNFWLENNPTKKRGIKKK